jgi:plastocyanin
MVHRFWRRAAVATLVLALVAFGGSAIAASKKAPNKATVQMKGKLVIKRNKYFKDGAGFYPGSVTIRSGGSLTLRNRQEAPHTFSIVKSSDVPRSTGKILNCGSPGTICDTIFTSHAPDPEGNPTLPVVNVGATGLDQPGDTLLVNPKQTQKVTVSAAKGTTLNFLCAIHPWMQGKLKVR